MLNLSSRGNIVACTSEVAPFGYACGTPRAWHAVAWLSGNPAAALSHRAGVPPVEATAEEGLEVGYSDRG